MIHIVDAVKEIFNEIKPGIVNSSECVNSIDIGKILISAIPNYTIENEYGVKFKFTHLYTNKIQTLYLLLYSERFIDDDTYKALRISIIDTFFL